MTTASVQACLAFPHTFLFDRTSGKIDGQNEKKPLSLSWYDPTAKHDEPNSLAETHGCHPGLEYLY